MPLGKLRFLRATITKIDFNFKKTTKKRDLALETTISFCDGDKYINHASAKRFCEALHRRQEGSVQWQAVRLREFDSLSTFNTVSQNSSFLLTLLEYPHRSNYRLNPGY